MNHFNHIQKELNKFIKKYYTNELIKGLLLFFSIGLSYFLFTIFIEYFLWLSPLFRTVLFWVFIVIELLLFTKYILIPVFKLFGLSRGISEIEASKLIGNHFPEVKDKLLNVLQLHNSAYNSELISASIQQKSEELHFISFKKAIDLSKNTKFLKYAVLPFAVWGLIYSTGNISIFNDSFSRVVHYKKEYEQPAPFYYKINESSFNVVEGNPLDLIVETIGNPIPNDVKIYFLDQSHYLNQLQLGVFEYHFQSVKKSFSFYFEANGVRSKHYKVQVISTPVIKSFQMELNFPSYTGKKKQSIKNTGNVVVPQGTTIKWLVEAKKTTTVNFFSKKTDTVRFNKLESDTYSYTKTFNSTTAYGISSSNNELTNFEVLHFSVQVLPDLYPKIALTSNIDSVTRGSVQFYGQVSDDYGITKLQLVYYQKGKKEHVKTHDIQIPHTSFTDFYYTFPEGLTLDTGGVAYEFYFEVFDNDAIHGSKKTASKTFSYFKKTKEALEEELLKKQKNAFNKLSNTLKNTNDFTKKVDQLQKDIFKKDRLNWDDSEKIKALIQRQKKYNQILENQTSEIQKNLLEQSVAKNNLLNNKKKELLKRLDEIKKLSKRDKMLEELKKVTDKIEKEKLADKLQKLTKNNKRNQQSLERILELTKRFYVEQKASKIQAKLAKLATEQQKNIAHKNLDTIAKKQDSIKKVFDNIQKDFKDLLKQNNDLKRPMKLPDDVKPFHDIEDELEKASENLNNQKVTESKKNQKAASRKMKQLSEAMKTSMMQMEGEEIEENIGDLRKVVENLITFSFKQESLYNTFSALSSNHPKYPENLKKQYVLKEYFEHIDDSLYTLSLRLVKMSSKIQKEVSDTYYYLDKVLFNFNENNLDLAHSNQHFVINSVNNLANMLSNLLESLLNASPNFGKGKGNSKNFTLPDVIKKQSDIVKQMKEGLGKKKKTKPGDTDSTEQMNGEVYEIYKQQQMLKETLRQLLNNLKNSNNAGELRKAISTMNELEKTLINKGITNQLIEKMMQLQHELLKLEDAKMEQGEDNTRKSNSNQSSFDKREIKNLELKKAYFNQTEILNRQSLPLQTVYQKKVQTYFKPNN